VALFFFKLYQVHKHFMTTVVKSYKLEEKFNYIIIMLRPPLIYRVEKPKLNPLCVHDFYHEVRTHVFFL
jgi:hypothetical protein